MNIPSIIKGFNVPAPSFPYIEGLPLYPFAEALFAALLERAAYIDRSISWSYPYPATGRGFCPVQSHTHEHFLILDEFDDELDNICSYYINQYTLNQITPSAWTFNTLLEKALELLGLQTQDSIAKLSSNNYGRTIASWGIQRAVMVSLLITIYANNSRYGKYSIKRMHADTGNNSNLSFEDSYSKAIANAYEETRETSGLGTAPFADYANFMYSVNSYGGPYMCNMSNLLEAKFIPVTNMQYLLECPAIMHLYVTYNTTGASTYIFDPFDSSFVEGVNQIPITFDTNGIFISKSFPKYPSGYMEAKYGWDASGGLVFDLSSKMQYGMTWNES